MAGFDGVSFVSSVWQLSCSSVSSAGIPVAAFSPTAAAVAGLMRD
jgi:hypothetical protein